MGAPRTPFDKLVHPLDALMSKVLKHKSGCWIFTGKHIEGGYGYMVFKGKSQFAHRVSWMLHNGPIPNRTWVRHKCNNPPCVNPNHLELGSPADNAHDRDGIFRARHLSEAVNKLYIDHIIKGRTPMQELYNCKQIDSKHYRITKFDKHLDPRYSPKGEQSSYIVSEEGCDCPAGSAPTCRHRKMLPLFAQGGYVDTEYFFVWDTHQWYKPTGIFAQARKAQRQELDVSELCNTMEVVGIPTVVIDDLPTEMPPGGTMDPRWVDEQVRKAKEGGQLPASAAPSPQPSRTFRRF